jgi:polysaccharide export outer membrane protein
VNGQCSPDCQLLDPVEFQKYAQGEYVGRSRLPHVPEYRLRVDDQLDFIYRLTREETREPYELNVGDEIRVESFTDKLLDRTLVIQPDGTITLPLLGQVRAGHHTVADLRSELEEQFKKYYKVPSIIVTPIKMNTQLDDLRNAIGGRSGFGPQVRPGKVTPEGTVQLPAVGTVPAQGLTLREFKAELDARYGELIEGVEVTPVLTVRAARYAYVLGEVKLPGRYTLEAPTTVMQAVALAGSWNFGANLHQVIIFRRADDWRLIATMLDLRQAFLGRKSCPAAEIWVSDSDLIILPKSHIQLTDNWIELLFTKGLYGMFPVSGSISYTNLTALSTAS